jgi:putative two-component system response regulator
MSTLVEDLSLLERALETQSPDAIAASVKSAATRLRESRNDGELDAIGKQIFAMGPKLFSLGRSHDVLPVVLAFHERAANLPLGELPSRTASFCGILFADTGDFSSSLDYQSFALKRASEDGDNSSVGRSWNNIGLAFSQSGHRTQALSAFEKAIEAVEAIHEPLFGRFIANANLANCAYGEHDTQAGLEFARRSRCELERGLTGVDPLSLMSLHRTILRLHLQAHDLGRAEFHFAIFQELANSHPSERAAILTQTLAAELDQARGNPDVALTRVEGALARSRTSWLTLRDTLASVVRLEASVGSAGRALVRLRELSEMLHRRNIDNAIEHRDLSAWRPNNESDLPGFNGFVTNILRPQLDAPNAPAHWKVLARLAVGNSVQLDGSGAHGLRVAALSELIALHLGFSPLEAIDLGLATQLHDIGLAYGHDNLLKLHDASSESIRPEIRDHCETGWTVLADDQHPRIMMARECAKYHHSWWNGAGYPTGVAGLGIPLHARICAVADTFDSLLCDQVANAAYSMQDALDETVAMAGTRLEPTLVDAFASALRGEIRNEGFEIGAPKGLQQLQQFIKSYSQSRNYI